MILNWRWGHGHRAAKGLAERQAASKHRRWNPNPGSLVCLNCQPRCHPYDTLCSLPSLTVALPADRTQRHVTAEELTTDRDKPHLNNEEQIKTYKTRERTCFWSIISCQSHRLRWWRWGVVRDSPNSLFLTELLRLFIHAFGQPLLSISPLCISPWHRKFSYLRGVLLYKLHEKSIPTLVTLFPFILVPTEGVCVSVRVYACVCAHMCKTTGCLYSHVEFYPEIPFTHYVEVKKDNVPRFCNGFGSVRVCF